MQKMDKRDLIRREEIKTSLETAYTAMRAGFAKLQDEVSVYNVLVERYNSAMEDARGFADDCANAIGEYIDGRSEKWQEGERGDAFNEWKSEFEQADFTDIDPIDISADEPAEESEAVETLVNLSEQPE